MSENNNNEFNTSYSKAKVVLAGKEMKKKSAMLVLSIILLVAAAVFFAYAWYTKMTAVSGVEFDVAQWEFNANYQGDGILAKVYNYDTSTPEKAAPGTDGYVPLHLSATQSDVDVDYFISVDKSSLSKKMQERLIFYFRNGDTKPEYQDNTTSLDTLIEFSSERLLAGTVEHGTDGKNVYFYWRWVYDLREALQSGIVTETYVTEQMILDAQDNEISDEKFYSKYRTQCDSWDEFDTKIGKNPEAYEKDFLASVTITGVQVESADKYDAKLDDPPENVVKPVIKGYNDKTVNS